MHKKTKLILFLLIMVMIICPLTTHALGVSTIVPIADCEETLLGNPKDENSVAWIVQQVLDFIKVVGPVLVLVLSSIDFAKVILSGDDKDMASAQKKLITRLFLAGALFLLPFLTTFLLDIFGLTTSGTCGIN